jgi:acyl carrier protein
MINKNIKRTVINLLAEQIGVEAEDINLEDSFSQDLHMSAADLTEFVENLEKQGFKISIDKLGKLNTVEELIELIVSEEEIG